MDIPAQHGRTALVTGANSGIGYETALALATAGADVTLAGRDEAKLAAAADRIRAQVTDANLGVMPLDLADLAAIEKAAATMTRPLDLLVNNAGVMAIPERRTTRDGFELTFGTNHLGDFALTGHLLPALLGAPAARVVTVSALAARWQRAALVDLASEHGYAPMTAYAKSKYANVVFTEELNRRAARIPLVAVAVHPGTSNTGLQRHGSGLTRWLSTHLLENVLGQSSDRAALPSLFAATSPTITGGEFIGPTGRGEGRGAPGIVALPANAGDPDTGRRLWDASEQLTGVHYDFD